MHPRQIMLTEGKQNILLVLCVCLCVCLNNVFEMTRFASRFCRTRSLATFHLLCDGWKCQIWIYLMACPVQSQWKVTKGLHYCTPLQVPKYSDFSPSAADHTELVQRSREGGAQKTCHPCKLCRPLGTVQHRGDCFMSLSVAFHATAGCAVLVPCSARIGFVGKDF